MPSATLAPAKVNLFLHVDAPQPDGFHPICSWMTFAELGDRVSTYEADAPEMKVAGPFAAALAGETDNLVTRAVRALLSRVRRPQPPFGIMLEKALPVAAGLGGGSSDAGAVLRLLRERLNLRLDDEELEAVASSLGSDGAACLWARPVIAEGRGERLSPAPRVPVLDAVLVHPGVPVHTAEVYARLDAMKGWGSASRPQLPEALESAAEVAGLLSLLRNDLEAAAVATAPEVGDALEFLRGEPESLLARVSGSGGACFALCASDYEAESLAERIEAVRPGWWVRRTRLGAPQL